MHIVIIGTGKVGSVLALLLCKNPKITKLTLINRTREKAEGLKMDLMGSFPEYGEKILVGEYRDANEADIIFLTCGVFGAPSGRNLFDVNKEIIESVLRDVKPKKEAKIVLTTTPIDELAPLVMSLTRLEPAHVIGFGGQLDVNRLKFLVQKDHKDFSKEIKVHFIGLHGASGIPIFKEEVSDRKQLMHESRNFFKLFLSHLNISTLGTSSELAKLADMLMSEKEHVVDISYYDKERNLFITWPCIVNKNGVKEPINLDLSDEERKGFEELIRNRSSK